MRDRKSYDCSESYTILMSDVFPLRPLNARYTYHTFREPTSAAVRLISILFSFFFLFIIIFIFFLTRKCALLRVS